MLDSELQQDRSTTSDENTAEAPAPAGRTRRRAASRPAGPPAPLPADTSPAPTGSTAPTPPTDQPEAASQEAGGTEPAPKRRRARKTAPAAAAEPEPQTQPDTQPDAAAPAPEGEAAPAPKARRSRKKAAAPAAEAEEAPETAAVAAPAVGVPLFQAPEPAAPDATDEAESAGPGDEDDEEAATEAAEDAAEEAGDEGPSAGGRRRRRRGGRGRRRKPTDAEAAEAGAEDETDGDREVGEDGEEAEAGEPSGTEEEQGAGATRRRRRRRRKGSEGGEADDEVTVTHVRAPRAPRTRKDADEVTALRGSTRLEAKKQRRREGRDAGRRRPPILTEAEFLARREAVSRVMVVRQRGELTQIGVLEDGVLVEHYVSSASASTLVGNVYLGKVQNVLPSMEAAFVDIGRGRNAVLYAGEVNWDAAGLVGQPKRIEHVLKSGDSVLAQVTKDPIGHKGARLTSNISLAGRFLVYVPDGSMNGISRKLPDKERTRLKGILKGVVPDDAGVIVRTAAEGASEEQLTHDVERLKERWAAIEKKAKSASAPSRLYGEPDLTVRVIRDLFNEDFEKLVVAGDEAWDTVQDYVGDVAPDLMDRVERYVGTGDVFHDMRIDEQIAKALDRKVWLPSGGSLVIDRTEAMTVVDVNTGKFVGKGSGNLEETVTRNNLEAAEEIVRQLRLRDVGGIIVIDFIDMVLESNRELVLRRLTECLGRDRTKHQVAEVTSLGLVQMTRKRIGTGLLEAFSEPCEVCNGRGVRIHLEPVEGKTARAERPDHSERVARVARAAKTARRTTGSEDEPEAADDAAQAAPVEGVDLVETPEVLERMETAEPLELAVQAEVVEPAADETVVPVTKPRRRRATKAAGAPEPVPAAG